MGCAGSASPGGPFDDNTMLAKLNFHDKYQLRGKLGRGAFAQVHLATKIVGSETDELAVKITDLRCREDPKNPQQDRIATDEKKVIAAEQEAYILFRVGAHPHIVQIVEDFQEGFFSYIVMERCDRSLLQVLERLPDVTEHRMLRLFIEMMQGIVHVHSLGVVHRDIKPDNFLCSGAGSTVKLCDFGLAAVSLNYECNLKGVYGTAPFMSPEMLGTMGYGAPTDVWSLGVIVYVLLLGRFPYQPVESTTKAMKAAILAGQPAPSFKCRAASDGTSRGRVSNSALQFLKALLCRETATRVTMQEALRHGWTRSEEEPDAPSLRSMLHSAKRSGAFDTRRLPDSTEHDKNSMDGMLAALQTKHHKADLSAGPVPPRHLCSLPQGARRLDRTALDTADAELGGGKLIRTESTTEPTTNGSNFSSSRSHLSAAA